MNQATLDFDEEHRTPHDYLAIVKRRKAHLIIPSMVVAVIGLAAIFSLPPTYTSQATILIEEQEVPREFVTSTISSFAAQQIQVISQRVLTAESIGRIADKYGLYTDEDHPTRPPATQIAQAFRNSMHLELVSADVIDPRSGRAQQATIAFTLAFDHGSPSTAQKVTNELVTLFLDENLRNRTERAANTEAFLAAEARSLATELSTFEAELAEFKRANEGALPELQQFNLSSLDRATSELSDIDVRLKELAKRKLELSAELAQTDPSITLVSADGEPMLDDRTRLKMLEREHRHKSGVYSADHPDIKRLEREIETLDGTLSGSGGAATGPSIDAPPDNPAYILLKSQFQSIAVEESALLDKREKVRVRIDELERRLSQAPAVERDYQALRRGYETTQAKYEEIRAKQREAALAESLEQERKGERFTLLEPPSLPLMPSSPNRPVLTLAALVLAIGAGIGMVILKETSDSAIYGRRELTRVTGSPPFAVVTYIDNSDDVAKRKMLHRWMWYGAAAAVPVAILFFNFFVQPLEVAWFMLMNRLGL